MILEPGESPRVYAVPPGADFPAALVAGILARCTESEPEALARTTLLVNTRRMRRRISTLFDEGPARLLPRLRLLTEVAHDAGTPSMEPPLSALRRRLELEHLVARLIATDPTLAPRQASFGLADSLASLLDEMQGEGVSISALDKIRTSESAGHWERSRKFLSLLGAYLAADGTVTLDPEARQRLAVEALISGWSATPPKAPWIVAGSTGSRGTTFMLMEAVARLPQGAVILPGFDRDMSVAIWDRLLSEGAEDHPQYRFARLLRQLGVDPSTVPDWTECPAPAPLRNRLVSLALRPAPVTNQWLKDGPELGDLVEATKGLSLIEAPDPRAEARAIAWLLREAAETGRRAALVTPDRMLTRRVTALLDRWDILPDDSAGRPLALSAPGRLLRQSAQLMAERAGLDTVLALLKHPLVHSGSQRGHHLLMTRDLELWLREKARPWVDPRTLLEWTARRPEERSGWAEWLSGLLLDVVVSEKLSLRQLVSRHLQLTRELASGSLSTDADALWDKPAGRKAAEIMAGLEDEADFGGPRSGADYAVLIEAILGDEEVREPDDSHPDIMIWGTLEARGQGADLVIMSGLNDGTWPDLPNPDPWLNRSMREQMGLLRPERRIGLAAHDFQQAIAAREVVLTRSLREDGAEPVPSRWLNRLTNLMSGLRSTRGEEALEAMRLRGERVLQMADSLDRPNVALSPEPRPSPRPPTDARPRSLSVTEIETLIRDPYAIYAKHLLGLRALRPLRPEADALLRGTILHRIFARFMDSWSGRDLHDGRRLLGSIADEEIGKAVAWPLAARLFRARIDKVADVFLEEERIHADTHDLVATEVDGSMHFGKVDFTLRARADRIDRRHAGGLVILDYKSGAPPGVKEVEHFRVQLLLEAVIAEAGCFEKIPGERVDEVRYVGLNGKPRPKAEPICNDGKRDFTTAAIRARFEDLVAAYDLREKGFTARRAVSKTDFQGDYDHLSRFGEWDDADQAHGEDVG